MVLKDVTKAVARGSEGLGWMRSVYTDSFPPEERRSWESLTSLAAGDTGFRVLEFYSPDGSPAGFLTVWRLPGFDYVEHFAVDGRLRGLGIGGKALAALLGQTPRPVVVEVELPETGDEAARRVGFYSRGGFVAYPGFSYVQPPYGPGLPEVPLMLMAANASEGLDLDHVAATLKARVYGVSR